MRNARPWMESLGLVSAVAAAAIGCARPLAESGFGETVEEAEAGADAVAGADAGPADAGPTDVGPEAAVAEERDSAPREDAAGDAAIADVEAEDAAGEVDAAPGADASPALPPRPSADELLVTEVMFEPSGSQPFSQWFEVYNLAAAPRLLSGLTIADAYPHEHTIAPDPPVVIPPQAYAVLVRDTSSALAAGIPAEAIVYDYGAGMPAGQGVELEDGTTGELSIWDGADVVADVPYGPWAMAWAGQSIELASLQPSDSDQQGSWCLAQVPWADGSDEGTPGVANDCP